MLTSLQALLRLAVLQRLGVFICALATLLAAANTASALERVQTKTRVWGFEFAADNTSGLFRTASSGKHQGNCSARAEEASGSLLAGGGVPRPTVTDPKLGNLVRDLYKGANTKNPIGTGSTADAIRHEAATGQAVGGKFHTQKGTEYARALEKWLGRNADASAADRSAAQSILNDLRNALGGK